MKKLLRILWLIFALIVMLPVILVVEMWWMFICIKSAKSLDQSVKWGVMNWLEWIRRGIDMNIDFVTNGL